MADLTEKLKDAIVTNLKSNSGEAMQESTPYEVWSALSRTVVDYVADDWSKTKKKYNEGRQEHYFSAEFLVGRSTLNNLVNLGIYDEAKEALSELGYNVTDILEQEVDAALGNGGLGRLAACFMDSSATLNYPVTGYGILYRFGLFRQVFENGFQKEKPDAWMESGYAPVAVHYDQKQKVEFGDSAVYAVPCDLPITGYHTDNVNTVRLWMAEPLEPFDVDDFNEGRFEEALEEKNDAEDIWRVLYPNDETREGKKLRLKQQYFFSSASLKDIIRRHKENHGDLRTFAEYNSIQLNDTHPVVSIPELIRLLGEEGIEFDEALDIAKHTFAYTNHTVLAEALEKWDIDLFKELLPDVYKVIEKINDAQSKEFAELGVNEGRANYLSILQNNQVHMAWLACYVSFSINGVARLHTNILINDTLKDWYAIYPDKFNNKTNGVTPRRWLNNSDPELASLLSELLGSDAWVTETERLEELLPYKDDEEVLKRFLDIKHTKKVQLADAVEESMGIKVNPDAQFDIIIKRIHEYKRQLLDAFYILDLYYRIKEEPNKDWPKRVFFFGGKAASGYVRAKTIIKFTNDIAQLVNNDPEVNKFIQVVFVENYNVSKAEVMFPAADVSEQISTAGKEASGTGNMKFMMNGALTLGTLDGANVEIKNQVGEENMYLFGATVEELEDILPKYDPKVPYENTPGLKRVVDSLIDGTFDDAAKDIYQDLYNSLMKGDWDQADQYYVLGDFASYREAKDRIAEDYFADKMAWAKKAWINICKSGVFSSDRTIRQYVNDIWKLDQEEI